MTNSVDDIRMKVAVSCRILGMLGLVNESTGHVSAHIPGTDEMWIRCRGGDECGLTFTGLHNVRRTDFDGKGAGVGDKHASPNETPIHGEIYRVFGAYDPSSLNLIVQGVPVFPRAVTVINKELAAEMLKSMGQRDVLLMQGHGITVTGPSVELATQLAIRFDRVARIMWEIAVSGREAPNISDEDIARYDRRGGGSGRTRGGWRDRLEGVENFGWNHYVKLLQAKNIGLPDDFDTD